MIYTATKMFPFHMAQLRKATVAWMVIPFEVSLTFWDTWAAVYRP